MTLSEFATMILDKNPDLRQEIIDNDGSNYQIVAGYMDGSVLKAAGKATGEYVKARDMIWALIDAAAPTTKRKLTI